MGPTTPLGTWLYGLIAPRALGYVVDTSVAINLLESANPAAAEWWRVNTPHLFKSDTVLLFDEACCVVEESAIVGDDSK